MISLKRLALIVGLIALPLVGHADQICDFEHRCYQDQPPPQPYHMDLGHPDRETPPPAPQYPPNADQGRDIVVQPNASGCRLFRMRSVPNIEPLIVELCPVSPDEERAIRERANGGVSTSADPSAQ
jgi:hypothetical protein